MATIGRPKGTRVTPSKAFVRLSADEEALIHKAIAILTQGVTGATITIASFLRESGIKEAKRVVDKS